MKIIKAGGAEEEFSEETIKRSSIRAGLSEREAEEIASKTAKKVKDKMTSSEVYENVVKEIRKKDQGASFRYSLKKAIMELGPTGYPFEKYVAEVLEAHGYKTVRGKHLPGRCVEHEVDVLAEKEGVFKMVECKYHNCRGVRSDVKVPLYVYARFLDVRNGWNKGSYKGALAGVWLVTNTKITSQAVRYGECVSMNLTAWRYPSSGGLEKMIEQKKLYPITVLPSLNKSLWFKLSKAGIILARDLDRPVDGLARKCRVSVGVIQQLKKEAGKL